MPRPTVRRLMVLSAITDNRQKMIRATIPHERYQRALKRPCQPANLGPPLPASVP